MATDLDQSYYEWSREGLTDQGDSEEITVSQMLDHGSISFGRFALEPLSWEKRSVFTHNRYQEELEKLRAPGLVAQKKAYFEEYYKRIRAMKALQENQCTEPALYCGYCSDISSEIMEENQRVVPSECREDGMAKIIGPSIEAASTEVTSDIDARFSNDKKNGEGSLNSGQCSIFDNNSNYHEPTMVSIEDSEQHNLVKLNNKQQPHEVRLGSISGLTGEENQRIVEKESHVNEFETSPPAKLSNVDKRAEYSQNKQLHSRDYNSFYNEPNAAIIEGCKQLHLISGEKEEIVKKYEKYVPNNFVYPASSSKVLELKLNKEQKKVNQAFKGHKDYTFSSEMMGHSSSSGGFIKGKHKIKSRTVTPTQDLKDSFRKRNGQINVCFISPKETADRVLSSKYASVTPYDSHKELISKVTTPPPFYLSSGKQSVSSSYVSPSSATPLSHNIISKAVSSNLRASYCLQREKLESSRAHKEHRKKPFITDRQVAHLTGGNVSNVIGPLKARSLNLPSCSRGKDVVMNSDKVTRNNEDGRGKLVQKAASPTARDPPPNAKNSPHGDHSLNRRKPQQEKPRWR